MAKREFLQSHCNKCSYNFSTQNKPKFIEGRNCPWCGSNDVLIKSKECSQVLQLMDHDYSYTEALNKVLTDNTELSRDNLDKELNSYI